MTLRLLPALLLVLAVAAAPAAAQVLLPDEQQLTDEGNTFGNEDRRQSSVPIGDQLPPFGSGLFSHGGFPVQQSVDLASPIMVGDGVSVRLSGAVETDLQTIVDPQGNIFIPELGPVQVAGVQAGALDGFIKERVREVYGENVDSYATVLDFSSIGVFVTGYVETPGRFAGAPTDSVIDYLARAGGIVPASGSYRSVAILRNGRRLYTTDLYSFLLDGSLRRHVFVAGDTILVGAQRPLVAATGAVRNSFSFEFGSRGMTGGDLNKLARPLPNVSNVLVEGTRNGQPYNAYVNMAEFEGKALSDQDRVTYIADRARETLQVNLEGTFLGESTYIVSPTTTLVQLLDHVPVKPELSAIESVSLKRRGVAVQQKALLNATLDRLEQTIFTAEFLTEKEANARGIEAQLIAQFIERARQAQPEGLVVVAKEPGQLTNLRLEDGDTILIPSRTELVNISGEVRIPQTVPAVPGRTFREYVEESGGYTERADEDLFIVRRLSGAVELVESSSSTDLAPGDVLIVPPEVSPRYLQIFLDLFDIVARLGLFAAIFLDRN
ncbi:MAG: polysaccharide biosynthesis/export family protein [Pseudomonadota bacterium]